MFAEYSPRVVLGGGDPRGGLEHPSYLDTQIFDNAFLPLNLPSEAPSRREVTSYTVAPGDTMSSIASKFNLKLSTLLWANNLSGASVLTPGAKLNVLPTNGVLHTVRSGETISYLSLLYQVYTEDIIEVNNLSDDGFIVIGQKLVIPGGSPLPVSGPRIVSERILADVRGALVNPAPGSRRSQGLHWRNAVDLANSCGANVVAAASGIVSKADGAGWNGGFGNYIMIGHQGGFVTVYAHLSRIFVENGQQVAQGEPIGSIGVTGRSTGCHVHFEVRGAQNPFAY